MKQYKLLGVLLLLAGSLLTACSDDEYYDFPGDPHNRVYLKDNTTAYKIVQTPIGSISNVKFETTLKCNKTAKGEIKATVGIDNSLIDAYNKAHDTKYEAMPAEAVQIQNATLTIPADTTATIDTLKVSLTDNKEVLASLNSENGYLIPLRLTSTSGGDAEPSTNLNTTYIIVTVTEDNVNHDGTESDIKGTLVEDQSGWSATTNGEVDQWYEPIETLFDNDVSSYCYITKSGGDLNLDVNMGKEYTFDAISCYYPSLWGGNSGTFSNGMKIYTSSDGQNWKQSGEITGSTSRLCIFYAPVTAQYIRLTTQSSGYSTQMQVGVFNIYETK